MKTLIIIAALLSINSCVNPTGTSKKILDLNMEFINGDWRLDGITHAMTYFFKHDNLFDWIIPSPNKTIHLEGTYTISNSTIICSYKDPMDGFTYVDTLSIEIIDENEILINGLVFVRR